VPPEEPRDPAILARAFLSSGTPLGPVFRVDQTRGTDKLSPDVDISSNGQIVFAWETQAQPGSTMTDIYARRYYDGHFVSGIELSDSSTTFYLLMIASLVVILTSNRKVRNRLSHQAPKLTI
jgi:hypothetical protein